MLYAHLTKIRSGYSLRVTTEIRPVGGTEYQVSDKRAARALAAQLGAKAWNF